MIEKSKGITIQFWDNWSQNPRWTKTEKISFDSLELVNIKQNWSFYKLLLKIICLLTCRPYLVYFGSLNKKLFIFESARPPNL